MPADPPGTTATLTVAPTWAAEAPRPAGPLLALPDRYEALGLIDEGGMALVYRAHDRTLDRRVAVKVLPPGAAVEAVLTARLEHPAIVPVYDLGRLPDGRVWYAMREVRGQTLRALSDRVRATATPSGWGTTADGWSLRRLIAAVETAARAIGYAHENGVLHRDIKPSNIMVGAFGEVQVLDWGLATERGTAFPARYVGTPPYTPPEWVREPGCPLAPPAEVYALGATLYAVLCGRPPYLGRPRGVLDTLRRGVPPRPLDERVPAGTPAPLTALVTNALALDPAARPATATDFADRLRAWLDGALRRAQAREVLDEARILLDTARARRDEAEARARQADRMLDAVPDWAPAEHKHPGWDAQDAAREARLAAEDAETRAEVALQAAISLDEHDPEPARALAALYRRQAERAARQGQGAAVRRLGRLIAVYDREGLHQDWLSGEVPVTLDTCPAGATVRAVPRRFLRRRLVDGEPRALGVTPLTVRLPAGRWRLEFTAPDRAEVHLPVRLLRGASWPAPPPAGASSAVGLPPTTVPGTRLVPAGWAEIGGDPRAVDPLSARRVWVDAFRMQTHPMTMGDWRVYLRDLVRRGRREQALEAVPAHLASAGGGTRSIGTLDEAGELHLDATGRDLADGVPSQAWGDDWAVSLVPWTVAVDYARWMRERTGQPWRLPHELEWEKAARGPDRRSFAWGEEREASWACVMASHEGTPRRAGVHDHPHDRGPYGVCGLVGNVRDLTCTPYSRAGDVQDGERLVVPDALPETAHDSLWVVRGGSWSSAWPFCRGASRFAMSASHRLSSVGLRLVLPVPDGG